MSYIKKIIQKIAHQLGYHVLSKGHIAGDMILFLEGLQKRGFNPMNILDLGAHKAEWAKLAAEYFPKAKYFLLEPQIEMKPFIDAFLQTHQGKWIQAGVGAKDEVMQFRIWEDFAGSSFLNADVEDASKQYRKLQVYSIDSLIGKGEMEIPDFCKIDIQGFEMEALKGSNTILGKTEVFVIELSTFEFMKGQPLVHEIIEVMAQKGYVIYDIAGFMNRPFDGAMGQIDICFVLKNSTLRQSNQW